MIRLFLREAALTAVGLVAATALTFGAVDVLTEQDWFDAARFAPALGLTPREAATASLPRFWNADVLDARARTANDLTALARPGARDAAMRALSRRGTAALPVVLQRLPTLAPEARAAALAVLAAWSPQLTGGERAPSPSATDDHRPALAWWDRYYTAHALDFRAGYAARLADRLAEHDSRNAAERVARLGTFGLTALVTTLERTPRTDGVARVTNALASLTGVRLAVAPDADVRAVADARAGWRAFWFARHLEFESLSQWKRALGHVTETRYGEWLVRALGGDLGRSRVTGRAVLSELRERLPASTFASGLGGLFAVAAVIAFGGGPVLQRRALREKLLDLAGALVPGLLAFAGAWAMVLRLCAPPGGAGRLAADVLESGAWARALGSAAACGALAALWFQRPAARVVLHAVRVEAESWVAESLAPTGLQVLRHGARIGVASLLAPLGIAAPVVLLASLLVELVFGLRGMGQLSLRAIVQADGPWILGAVVTVVPLLLAGRWSLGLLAWVLGVRHDTAPQAEAPAGDQSSQAA